MNIALIIIILGYIGVSVVWALGVLAFYMVFVAPTDWSGDAGLAFMLLILLPVIPWMLLYDRIVTKKDTVRGRVYRWPTKKQRAAQVEHDKLIAEYQNQK